MADLNYHPEAKNEIRKEAAFYERERRLAASSAKEFA